MGNGRIRSALKNTAKLSSLALAVNLAFTDESGKQALTEIDWDRIIKDPVALPDTGPALPMARGDRVHADPLDAQFNSVGRVLINGHVQCSGNVIGEIEGGYRTNVDGMLVSTAAHCIDGFGTDEDITFALVFVNAEDEIERAEYNHAISWYNPAHTGTSNDPDTANDQALIFFPNQSPPEEVTPSILRVHSPHVIQEFGQYEFMGTPSVSAGYSTDMDGLSTDPDCHITDVMNDTHFPYTPYIKTDCSLWNGASGSGLITDNFNGSHEISAVTASKLSAYSAADEDFRSFYSLFFHEHLLQVPFIEREQICARVTTSPGSNLNIRIFDHARGTIGEPYMTVASGDILYVTDMLYDTQERYGPDDTWIEIRTLDNPDPFTPNGYANAAFLEETDCPPSRNTSLDIKF